MKKLTRTEIASRIRGSILLSAMGDALGEAVEFSSRASIMQRTEHRGLRQYLHHEGRISDDTQMSLAVIEGLLDANTDGYATSTPEAVIAVARRFVTWKNRPMGGHRAPGGACLSGCSALQNMLRGGDHSDRENLAAHLLTAGGAEAGGCGTIMRSGPYGLFHIGDPDAAAAVAASHARLTHRHPMAIAAAAAIAAGVSVLAAGEPVPVAVDVMILAAMYHDTQTAAEMDAVSTLTTFDHHVLERWRSWSSRDAAVAAVHVLQTLGDAASPLESIIAAVNQSGDSDSLAAMVGALVGAHRGDAWMENPEVTTQWLERLEFRDVIERHAVAVIYAGEMRGQGRKVFA